MKIDHVLRAEGRALFVLRDFHPFLEPAVVRRLRDAATELRKTKKGLCVLLAGDQDSGRAREEHLGGALTGTCRTAKEDRREPRKVLPNLPAATRWVIERPAVHGPRRRAALRALRTARRGRERVRRARCARAFDLETILEEKKQIIRKSGLLEYYEHREEFSDVGGMDILKDWLVKYRAAFGSRARTSRIAAAEGHPADRRARHPASSRSARAVGALWPMHRCCGSTSTRSSAASSAAPRRTCGRSSRRPKRSRRRSCGSTSSRRLLRHLIIGLDRRRHHVARVRVVHHVAAGKGHQCS